MPHAHAHQCLPTYLLFCGKANEMLLIVLRISFRFNFANVSFDKRVPVCISVFVSLRLYLYPYMYLYLNSGLASLLILQFVVIYQ